MIVCHCMQITDRDIGACVAWMRASDPDTIITAGKIYRALDKRADCGGCMKLFVSAMRGSEGFAVDNGRGNPPVPDILCGLRRDAAC